MIIAGDIGGTKTNVALFEPREGGLVEPVVFDSYPSKGYDSLEAILEHFISAHRPRLTHACFGVAGPVQDGFVATSNLAWDVRAQSLQEVLRLPRVKLINDLEAAAYGVGCLRSTQLHTLHEGREGLEGHRALIAAGTGLGMAGLFWDGRRHRPIPSEGGHIDFAPRNEREIELLRHMKTKIGGRVSYERVLSGPGLFDIYEFLRSQNIAEEEAWLAEEIRGGDPSAAVSKAALEGRSQLASEALETFASIYGGMAGDLVML